MSQLTEESVRTALRGVTDREAGIDVIAAGLVSGIVIRADKVGFMITIDPADKDRKAYLREACEAAVKIVPGVASVTAVLTAQNSAPIPPSPQSGYAQPRERAAWNQTPLDHVKKIIAVASGKGGVGKSTVAVNLALAVARGGKRAGLLDADIYGPSIPRMLALSGQPKIENGKMIPLIGHGVACNSMGFITGDEAAILRGPMISKTLQQLLRATRWGTPDAPLDMLIVDMPPGTGDIHLSMAQQVPLDGAIIVTTPQQVALEDACKCAKMFLKLGVKLLVVVENMRGPVFGEGGGSALAQEFSVKLLGSIAMDAAICQAGDVGEIYQGNEADSFTRIAAQLS
jgi:ATP-binding protein involved in chromosome partitioning